MLCAQNCAPPSQNHRFSFGNPYISHTPNGGGSNVLNALRSIAGHHGSLRNVQNGAPPRESQNHKLFSGNLYISHCPDGGGSHGGSKVLNALHLKLRATMGVSESKVFVKGFSFLTLLRIFGLGCCPLLTLLNILGLGCVPSLTLLRVFGLCCLPPLTLLRISGLCCLPFLTLLLCLASAAFHS